MTPCEAALASEPLCQQAIRSIGCAVSCQRCSDNNGTVLMAQPTLCRSQCEALYAGVCNATVEACTGVLDPFGFICAQDDNNCVDEVWDVEPVPIPPPPTVGCTDSIAADAPDVCLYDAELELKPEAVLACRRANTRPPMPQDPGSVVMLPGATTPCRAALADMHAPTDSCVGVWDPPQAAFT